MESSWHILELEAFVKETKNSKEHLERIKSVSRTIELFEYHLYTAKKSNDSIGTPNLKQAMELIFTPKEKLAEVFETKLIIQANSQACIHTARSIYDLFAQLVNGLLLSEPLPLGMCDFFKIKDKLENSKLKDYLSELSATEEFLYVNAFVNTIKHRNLVSFDALADTGEGKIGVKFQPFIYNGETYPAMWAEEVLKQSLFVKNSIVKAGILLNRQLGVADA